jgi:thiamine-phosphate pyrophosphorylase
MRIIDANLNRLTEGLRVVEDVFRYARDNAPLQQRLKTMRHRVSSSVDMCPFIESRDAAHDVGLNSEGLLENSRGSLHDIVRSNLKRVQEACRVLEEVMKLEHLDASRLMKELRYECYQIERDFELTEGRTVPAGLFLILSHPGDECAKRAEEAVKAQVPVILLEYPGRDDQAFLRLARDLRKITGKTPTLLIVHGRVDVALAAQADGIHLEGSSLAPGDARDLAGESMILGLSAGTLEEVEEAQNEPVDYIMFGPVFPSPAGEAHKHAGVGALREAARISRLPVVAEGGIDGEALKALAGIPLKGVTCTGAVSELSDMLKRIGEMP